MIRVMSGDDRSPAAIGLRGLLAVIEPVYAKFMTLRNWAYSRHIFQSHPLPRPTISVGNLITGGTGKTPIVRWLAEEFIARGMRPAVLMRGYRSDKTRSEEHTSELQSRLHLVCRLLLEKKK